MRPRARRERALVRDRRRFHGRLNVWPNDPLHLYALIGPMGRPYSDLRVTLAWPVHPFTDELSLFTRREPPYRLEPS